MAHKLICVNIVGMFQNYGIR